MKLKLTYSPGEEREADLILRFTKGLLPGLRVRKSAPKAPYIHVYLTTRKPGNPCNIK